MLPSLMMYCMYHIHLVYNFTAKVLELWKYTNYKLLHTTTKTLRSYTDGKIYDVVHIEIFNQDSTLGDVNAQIKYWRKHSLSLVVRVLLNLCNMNSKAIRLIGFLARLWNIGS